MRYNHARNLSMKPATVQINDPPLVAESKMIFRLNVIAPSRRHACGISGRAYSFFTRRGSIQKSIGLLSIHSHCCGPPDRHWISRCLLRSAGWRSGLVFAVCPRLLCAGQGACEGITFWGCNPLAGAYERKSNLHPRDSQEPITRFKLLNYTRALTPLAVLGSSTSIALSKQKKRLLSESFKLLPQTRWQLAAKKQNKPVGYKT